MDRENERVALRWKTIASLCIAMLVMGHGTFAQELGDDPKDPIVEMPDDSAKAGMQSVTWPLPGKTAFNARTDMMAKRWGVPVSAFRDKLLTEMEALKDASTDANKPAAGNDEMPVGYANYSVYVPADYVAGRPYGLMVYINSGDGTTLGGKHQSILDKHRMIWIGIKGAGNSHAPIFRILLAIDAVEQVKQRYTIDDERVYVSGFSGGGRAASIASVLVPDTFSGGFFFCGVNYYRDVTNSGMVWSGFAPKLDARLLQAAQRNGRFVLQTGTKDMNLSNTRAVFDAFKKERFNATYIEVTDAGHTPPPMEEFDQGLTFLDAPLMSKVDALYKNAVDLEKRKKLGEACIAYERAAVRGADKPFAADAATKGAAIRKMYAEKLAEVRTLITGDQPTKATSAIAQLKTAFGPLADKDADALVAEATEARRLKKPGA